LGSSGHAIQPTVELAIVGYVYTALLVTLPFLWLLPVIASVVVYAWSWGLRFLARWLKLYNKKSQLLVAVLSSVVLFYGQWVAFVSYLNLERMPSIGGYFSAWGIVLNLEYMRALLLFLYEEGYWEIFGMPLKSSLLLLCWLAEATVLLTGPALLIWSVPLVPYSNNQDKWYHKYSLEQRFGTLPTEQFIADLQRMPIPTIEQAPLGKAGRYRKLELYHLPQERQSYATLKLIKLDHKGNRAATVAEPPFLLNEGVAKTLIEHYQLSKERLKLF
jgi:hypothetical protein